jgi:uncharacterized phage protein gp47/JayE
MAVLIKNRDRLIGETLDALDDTGLLTNLTPGSAAFVMAEIASTHLADIYNSLEANTALSFVSTARGPFLDLIAESLQVSRLPEQAAIVLREERNIRFFVNTGTLAAALPAKVISAGSLVSTTDDSVEFQVLEDTPFNDVVTEVFVSAVSTGVGVDQNVGKNELIQHNLGVGGVFVTNNNAVSSAADIETDSQLRARIADAMLTRATGNLASLREAVNIIPGVSEVRFRPHVNGPGTVEATVVPVSNNPGERVKELARANVEQVRSAGTIVDIKSPRFVPFEIVIILRFRNDVGEGEKPQIRSDAVGEILNYLEELRIGQLFVVKELIQRVMDTDDRILDFDIRCFAFNRREQVVRNFAPDSDEIIIPDPRLEEPIKVL